MRPTPVPWVYFGLGRGSARIRANTDNDATTTPAGVDAPSTVLGGSPSEDWAGVDAPPRVPLGERLRRRRAGAPPPAEAKVRRGRGAVPLIIVGVVALVILVGGWFLFSIFQPFHGDGSGRVSVVIPKGATINDAGDVMADRGVISSAFFFKLRAKVDGPAQIIPGTYVLPEGHVVLRRLRRAGQGPAEGADARASRSPRGGRSARPTACCARRR